FAQTCERFFGKAFPVGRIAEDKIERRESPDLTHLRSVAPENFCHTGQRKCLYIRADEPACLRAFVDEERELRAARHRFQPKRASACEKVEHARVRDWVAVCMRENVEDRFAQLVR